MKEVNIYMSDLHLASQLREKLVLNDSLFDTPEIKSFTEANNFLILERILVLYWITKVREIAIREKKMDYMFLSAEGLKKYHRKHNLNLKEVVKKYGAPEVKVIIMPCTVCAKCNDHVKHWYSEIIEGFCSADGLGVDVDSLIECYFKDLLAIN